MNGESYRNLVVWQKSVDLVVEVYRLTEKFPKEEIYELTSQMRRASVSIPSNIAEGSRRGSKKDFKNFILIAYGSGSELETQIEISLRLGFIERSNCKVAVDLLDEVMRMLNTLSHRLLS